MKVAMLGNCLTEGHLLRFEISAELIENDVQSDRSSSKLNDLHFDRFTALTHQLFHRQPSAGHRDRERNAPR
jgi:hypothetical protein